jgi:hypothetical protein
MSDVVFLAITLIFYVVSLAYAAYCDQLMPRAGA